MGMRLQLFAFSFLLFTPFANAQDSTTLYIKSIKEPVTKTPGGGRMGEIYRNTPVTVIEEKGEWIKVSFTGWVVRDSLTGDQRSSDVDAVPQGLLRVDGYEVKKIDPIRNASDQTKRVFLRLRIKNHGQQPINGWSGMLIVKNQAGDILFREGVSDKTTTIAPGEVSESIFSWEDGENQYIAMLSQAPDAFQISLGLLKFNTN